MNSEHELVAMISSPLPPAADFTAYEKCTPGAGDRILSVFEKQSEHRRVLEEKSQERTFALNSRGQWMAFVIALLGIGLIGAGIYFKQPVGQVASVLVALSGLVMALLGKRGK